MKCGHDSLGFLHYTSSVDASNLLRFNLPIISSRRSAYVLYDCGASHKFVRNEFLNDLRKEGLSIQTRRRGWMVITTANSEQRIPRFESLLEIDMDGYVYKGWFIHFELLRYDIILGKDWMATTQHTIDHEKNILYLGYSDGRWQHSVIGLPARVSRAQGSDFEQVKELKVLEQGKRVQQTEVAAIGDQLNREIAVLRKRYERVFQEPAGLPPDHLSSGFRIRLKPDASPPYRSPYRLTIKEKESYERTIQQLLAKRHIRRSVSPYAAPVMFVPKAGGLQGDLRMVIDYRALNRQTIKDRYPLPYGEELIDRLQGAKVFSKLDFWSGFHQHRMAPQDIEKTAFVGPDGLYEWLVMPFGLANAPSEFMRVMSHLLREHIQAGYCVVFIDDILVYSKNSLHHISHLKKVLDTVQRAGYRLRPDKCHLGRKTIEFLGFSVDGSGVQMLSQKVESICDWPLPLSPKEMRSFVGLAGVYRKFIPRFAQIALPLLELIPQSNNGYSESLADPKVEAAVQNSIAVIKRVITSAPALALPEKGNNEFLVRTDASGFAIGATLRQMQWNSETQTGSKDSVLAYFSRKLSGPETRYSTYDQELLAVKDAIEHWRYYLHGSHFKVQTDHSSLRHVLRQPKLSSRQMRILERLQEYDFDIEYLPGAQNYIQDALSRRADYRDPPIQSPRVVEALLRDRPMPKLPESGTVMHAGSGRRIDDSRGDKNVDVDLFTLMTVNADSWLQEVRDGYKEDKYFAEVIQPGEEQNKGNINEIRKWKARRNHYTVGTDALLTHVKSGTLCIPNSGELRQRLLQEAHDTPVGGHFGILRTASALSRRFFWPRLYQDVKQYVRGCASCHRSKASNQKPYGLLQPLEVPAERWKRINIDFIVKLPVCSSGNDTIITFIDGLTKRAHWIATVEKSLSAERFAEIFVDFYFRLHGLPTDIVSDRDVRFTSDWWRHLTKIWQTKLKMSTSFHPQTDGQAEKANSIVERYLRSFVQTRPQEWDRLLSLAEFSYNAHRHPSTGLAPFEADLGYIPRLPMDIIAEGRPSRPEHHGATSFATTMADILYQLQEALGNVQSQQRKEANKKRQPHTFQTGDKVLINTRNLPVTYGNTVPEQEDYDGPEYGLRRVFQQRFIGEFTLGEQRGANAFEIADLPSNSRMAETFNVDQLRPSQIDHSRSQPKPPPVRVISHPGSPPTVEYEVEKILEWRQDDKGKAEFLVKWVGLDAENDLTWEKQNAFTGAREALSDFISLPQNAELAHILRWPRKATTHDKAPSIRARKERIKGKSPSRRSSRIQSMKAIVP